MLTRDEHLAFCKRCTNRQFDPQQGVICKLTGRAADFETTCPTFVVDPSVPVSVPSEVDSPVVLTAGDLPEDARIAMRKHQDLPYALIGGVSAAIVGAMVWGLITFYTHYQIGYMAIAVGLLVGFAVRYFGAGIDMVYGIVGATCAVLGCALGNLLGQVGFIAEAENMGYFEVIPYLNFSVIGTIFQESFSPMDVVFYGIAGYEGYKFAFRPVTEDLIQMAKSGAVPPIANANLRFPLVAALFVILSITAVLIFKGGAGLRTVFYESGAKHYEGEVVNGVEQGAWTFWWENGQVQQKGFFRDGKLDSLWEYFNEDGQRYRSGSFKSNLQDGAWQDYHPNGKVAASGNYYLGRQHGSWIYYYEDGTVSQRGHYELDIMDSAWEVYNTNGSLASKGSYRLGVPIGPWTYRYEDGKPSLDALFDDKGNMRIQNSWQPGGKQEIKNGTGIYTAFNEVGGILETGPVANQEKVGTWKKFFAGGRLAEVAEYQNGSRHLRSSWAPDGTQMVNAGEGNHRVYLGDSLVVEEGRIVNGLRDGQWINFSFAGSTIRKCAYKQGVMEGPETGYHENGAVAVEGLRKNDLQHGEWKWYHANGQLETSVVFASGKKIDNQVFYDEEGAVVKTEVYEMGKLVDVKIN